MKNKDYDADALRASFQMIGVDYAAPSPTNPRKSFPEAEMADLIASVKQHGVLQPIICRIWPMAYPQPSPMTTYEIIAGERRWRAAKAAGLTMLEGKVRELTDLEVLEIQIIENLQRADLHPLDEAEGYERIMGTHAYTAEQLGEKIGKSRSYIFGRLKLLALDAEARRLFRGGLLNPSTALLIARIPTASLRAKAIEEITRLDYNKDTMSVREAQRHIKSRYMLKLADAKFPIADATLTAAGSCETCPSRTGNAPDLFEDVESPDVCTDPDCFAAKKIAHRDREAEKAVAAGGTVIIGKDAEKIAGTYGIHDHSSIKGYTQLDKTCYDDPERRTYGEILGGDVERVLIEDTCNHAMVPVIPNAILADKLLAAGVKMRENETAKVNAKVEAKIALERATRVRLFDELRDEAQVAAEDFEQNSLPAMKAIISAVTLRLWERGHQDINFKLANLWSAAGKNNTERAAAFAQTIPRLSNAEHWRLLVDMLTISGVGVASEWDLDHGGGALMHLSESVFGINTEALRKSVAAEIKAKESEAKPAKKGGKKPALTASQNAPDPSEAARAADLTGEKVGANIVFTSGHVDFLPEGDPDRRFFVVEAAQAGEQPAEENQATPSAGADLIEMDETPAKPPVVPSDAIQVGDRIRIRATCKNWRMAAADAVITMVVQPGVYRARYGAGILEVSALVDSEIAERLPASHIPNWDKEARAHAKPAMAEAMPRCAKTIEMKLD